jgi:diacylglycerol kinase family enzyme
MWALLMHRKDLSGDPNLVRFSCDALTIAGDGAPPLQADGDIVTTLPVDLKIAAETQSFA